jgi:hypothetical protein
VAVLQTQTVVIHLYRVLSHQSAGVQVLHQEVLRDIQGPAVALVAVVALDSTQPT